MRLAQEFRLEAVDEQRRVGIVCRPHDRGRDQLGQGFGEPALADQAELGQHPVEPAAGLGGDAAGALQGALVDRTAVEQGGAQPGQRLGGVLGGGRGDRCERHDAILSWPAMLKKWLLLEKWFRGRE